MQRNEFTVLCRYLQLKGNNLLKNNPNPFTSQIVRMGEFNLSPPHLYFAHWKAWNVSSCTRKAIISLSLLHSHPLASLAITQLALITTHILHASYHMHLQYAWLIFQPPLAWAFQVLYSSIQHKFYTCKICLFGRESGNKKIAWWSLAIQPNADSSKLGLELG